MAAAVSQFGGIDIVVLNAGVGMHNFFHKTDDMSVYKKLMDINFFGYLYCTKYAFPALKQSKGSIVVVSSVSGAVCSACFAICLPHRRACLSTAMPNFRFYLASYGTVT